MIQAASVNQEDAAFYKWWYSHMQGDLMQPPLNDISHSLARMIWDAALQSAQQVQVDDEIQGITGVVSVNADYSEIPTAQPEQGERIGLENMLQQWQGDNDVVMSIAAYDELLKLLQSAQPVAQPLPLTDEQTRDLVAEAIRKQFVKLERYSFLLDDNGNVRRVHDKSGRWVDFVKAHELFDPVCVDAALSIKPLTDQQIYEMYSEPSSDAEMLEFARAIEAAHGIGGAL